MREAMGGTGLLYIVTIFLFVYICFMAVVINYGRVFRVKNSVISYIEQYEGIADSSKVKSYASQLGYTGDLYVCYTKGSSSNVYFSVKLQIAFEAPLIGLSIDVPVSGETSAIKNASYTGIYECGSGSNKWKDSMKL